MEGISDIELALMFNITIGAVRNRICKIRKENDSK
jgi:DNA-directed RNA polymerase specialized sigma24 family protein